MKLPKWKGNDEAMLDWLNEQLDARMEAEMKHANAGAPTAEEYERVRPELVAIFTQSEYLKPEPLIAILRGGNASPDL
jgi:hypothetical protein